MKMFYKVLLLVSIFPPFLPLHAMETHRTIIIHIEKLGRAPFFEPQETAIVVNGVVKRCSFMGCRNNAASIFYTAPVGLIVGYCTEHKDCNTHL